MPQLDIKNIEIFHRDNYPATTGRISEAVRLDLISVIIDPEFSEIENKAEDFFDLKPRRFVFSVRDTDSSFFDSIGTYLIAHPSFPKLTDYMLRVFDNSDNQIFEGIISMNNSYADNEQIIEITAYDPIVLFSDSSLEFSTLLLETSYKDPHDFQVKVFDTLLTEYFSNSVNKPAYQTSWTAPDWNLESYQDVHDFGDLINDFYENIRVTYTGLATAQIGAYTDVYDYSQFSVRRTNAWYYKVCFEFIGCIVFHNKSTNKNYICLYHKGVIYDAINQETTPLSDDSTSITALYGNSIDTYGHFVAKYFSRFVYLPIAVVINATATPSYWTSISTNLFNPYDIINRMAGSWGGSLITALPIDSKAQIESNDYPHWCPKNTANEDIKYDWDLPGYIQNIRSNLYDENMILTDEGGNAITIESDKVNDAAYCYQENDYGVYDGYNYTTVKNSVNFSDGYIEFCHPKRGIGQFNFHVNYYIPYPLTASNMGVADTKLHKQGNVSRIIGYLPQDITVRSHGTSDDYIFDNSEEGGTYYNFADLLKFFLASMNLYCYYSGREFKLERSFLSSAGTPIVIDDEDIIDWKTQAQEPSKIDCSSVLKPSLNYVATMINPYYNTYAALDNKRATCKISKLIKSPSYGIVLNSTVTAKTQNWRVEKLKECEAFYDVVLTKYITDPGV